MTLIIRDTDSITTGINTALDDTFDDFYLLSGVLLASTQNSAIYISAGDMTLHLDGTVVADQEAIDSASVGNLRVEIGATGTVTSYLSDSIGFGIALRGGNSTITNLGSISAPEAISVFMRDSGNELQNYGSITGTTGVQLFTGSDSDRVFNAGVISGSDTYDGVRDVFEGVGILAQGTNTLIINTASGSILTTAQEDAAAIFAGSAAIGLRIENAGLISAVAGPGISAAAASFAGVTVINTGTVRGTVSVAGSDFGDTVRNAGVMQGNVALSGGDDVYVATGGGRVLFGEILGEAGADTLIGGDTADVLSGGEDGDLVRGGGGADTISGGSGADVLQGEAGDDEISGEDGEDALLGGAGDDTLFGGQLNDKLFGGSGDDVVSGGAGRDLLNGDAGADVFRFVSVTESLQATSDVIRDFERGLDVIDLDALNAGELSFMGTGGFATGGAASVRYALSGTTAVVFVDNDGDRVSDMRILLFHTAALDAGDFVL